MTYFLATTEKTHKKPMRKRIAAPLLAMVVATGACAQMQDNPKTIGGTIIGAGAGAVAGAQFGSGEGQLAATALGTLLGAFIGNQVGQSLDRADRMYMERASQRAETAPIGQTISWENPDSGNSGTITPVRRGHNPQGKECREFRSSVVIDGRIEEMTGIACRRSDGLWEQMPS
jgi:surface antigen